MSDFAKIATVVLSDAFLLYIFAGFVNLMQRAFKPDWGRLKPINWVWKLSKWPALLYVICLPVLDVLNGVEHHWWTTLLYVWNGWVWWVYHDEGDDDDFKRLGKKVTEKVKQLGSKLVVVPQTQGV